jgi:hypothetical protein
MNSKLTSGLLAAAVGAASAATTPASAFIRFPSGMHFGGGMFAGRSVFTPGLNRAFTPGVNRAFTPGVNRAFTPGVNRAFTPGVNRAFTPGVNRFVPGAFSNGHPFANRFHAFPFDHRFAFHHRHFRNFAFFGYPFAYDSGYDGCWRQIATPYGWQWRNICYDYGYGYGY